MLLDNKCRIGLLAFLPLHACVRFISIEPVSWFISEDHMFPVGHTPTCPWSLKIKSPLSMTLDQCWPLNYCRFFLLVSGSRIRIFSFKTTECSKDGNRSQIFYRSFWCRCGHSCNWVILTLICILGTSWLSSTVDSFFRDALLPKSSNYHIIRSRWLLIQLFEKPACLGSTIQPLLFYDNCLYCRRLRFRDISSLKTVHPSR